MSVQEQRRNKIIELLQANNYLSVFELSESLLYSEATIKRDLSILANDGIIRRTRGGAAIIDENRVELPYMMKLQTNTRSLSQTKMASKAKTLLADDLVIFLDSSSTVLHIVYELKNYENLKIITNGLVAASYLTEHTDAKVFIIGGEVTSKTFTINGSKAYSDTMLYNADIAFMSSRGFDLNKGATEVDQNEALMKSGLYSNATKSVLMVGKDKFKKVFTHSSIPLKEIDYLITDEELSDDEVKKLKDNNIEVIENN